MNGQSKMNERLVDMTPYMILLDVRLSSKTKNEKKDKTHI